MSFYFVHIVYFVYLEEQTRHNYAPV